MYCIRKGLGTYRKFLRYKTRNQLSFMAMVFSLFASVGSHNNLACTVKGKLAHAASSK